jgi:hypothetical protein
LTHTPTPASSKRSERCRPDPQRGLAMADNVENNGPKHLLDLPIEILRVIFREVCKSLRLGCELRGTYDRTAKITYPSVLLVSKRYFDAVKKIALEEGVVLLGGLRFELPWTTYIFPELQLVQHLDDSDNIDFDSAEALTVAVKTATQLKSLRLNLDLKSIWLPEDWNSWSFVAEGGPIALELASAKPGIIRYIQNDLAGKLSRRLKVWGGVVEEWMKRGSTFEICIVIKLLGSCPRTNDFYHLSVRARETFGSQTDIAPTNIC